MTSSADELEAIRQLKARYFRFMDTKDWDAWRELFTDDVLGWTDNAVSTRGAQVSGLCLRMAAGTSQGRPPISHSVQLGMSLVPHITLRSVTAFCATGSRLRLHRIGPPVVLPGAWHSPEPMPM